MSTQKTAWLIVACGLLLFAREGLAQEELPDPPRMLTIVVSGEWGDAQHADIEKLLSDTASHINGLLRSPWAGELHVKPAAPNDRTPRILFRYSKTGPIVIQLTSQDRRWNQYAYQFAHEFCHVLSGYEDLKDNPNNWFHETICELASVFTLRRMAERWPTHPPYPNWSDYSKYLLKYATDRQKREEVQLPMGTTLPDWLSSSRIWVAEGPISKRQERFSGIRSFASLRGTACWMERHPQIPDFLWRTQILPVRLGIGC